MFKMLKSASMASLAVLTLLTVLAPVAALAGDEALSPVVDDGILVFKSDETPTPPQGSLL